MGRARSLGLTNKQSKFDFAGQKASLELHGEVLPN